MVEMYGIANCDTIKKARKWLHAEGIDYRFHDYKKEGASASLLTQWCKSQGWETLLNRRGTSWRNLADASKTDIDEIKAIASMVENPSMIKRPVLVTDGDVTVGFSNDRYRQLFNS